MSAATLTRRFTEDGSLLLPTSGASAAWAIYTISRTNLRENHTQALRRIRSMAPRTSPVRESLTTGFQCAMLVAWTNGERATI